MNRLSSVKIFSILFAIVYVAAFILQDQIKAQTALFSYYPDLSEFHLTPLTSKEAGPAITWYGWISTAAIISAIIAYFTPRKFADRLPASAVWGVLGIVVIGLVIYETTRWFI